MVNRAFTESTVEAAGLGWLAALGYQFLHNSDFTAGELRAERTDPNYHDVLRKSRLASPKGVA